MSSLTVKKRKGGVKIMSCKGFTAGLVTGAIAGAALGMLVDPIDDKSHRRMRRTKENLFRTVAGMMEDMMDR